MADCDHGCQFSSKRKQRLLCRTRLAPEVLPCGQLHYLTRHWTVQRRYEVAACGLSVSVEIELLTLTSGDGAALNHERLFGTVS